ncbi:hypothetical protein Tco_0696337 [Tanacetum coccineum]
MKNNQGGIKFRFQLCSKGDENESTNPLSVAAADRWLPFVGLQSTSVVVVHLKESENLHKAYGSLLIITYNGLHGGTHTRRLRHLQCDNHDLSRQDLGFIPSGNVVLSSTYVGKILGADQLLVILCYRYQESGIGYWILSMTISGSGVTFLPRSTKIPLLSQPGVKGLRIPRRGNRKIRVPIAMWPCKVEEKMTLKEVDGKTIQEFETKIIAKDGTITRIPGLFQGYETSEEESVERPKERDLYGFVDHPQLQQRSHKNEFAPHWLPQSSGNMNGWLVEDEDEVDSDLESTASSKPVWEKTNKDDRDCASYHCPWCSK